jgi:hypothetical protein
LNHAKKEKVDTNTHSSTDEEKMCITLISGDPGEYNTTQDEPAAGLFSFLVS